MIEGKKIFITGGAGFIGSTLAGKLLDRNEVTVFDNFSRDTISGTDFADHPNLRRIRGDILDAEGLNEASEGAQIFVHAAAIAGIDHTARKPVDTMRTNMLGTAYALEAANRVGTVERFLEFSTSEVFGSRAFNAEETDQTVTGAVGEPRWAYAVSKLAGEHLAHAYYREFGFPIVTVRPFNVYGPGQMGEGAISIMIRKALSNDDIYIFGDGGQIRAWCYVDDLVAAVMKALVHPAAVGESFNVGNARAVTTILGLADTIRRVLGSDSKIVFRDALSADIELRIPNTQKAARLIGFEAEIDLETGLARTAEWIRTNMDRMPEMPNIFKKNV